MRVSSGRLRQTRREDPQHQSFSHIGCNGNGSATVNKRRSVYDTEWTHVLLGTPSTLSFCAEDIDSIGIRVGYVEEASAKGWRKHPGMRGFEFEVEITLLSVVENKPAG